MNDVSAILDRVDQGDAAAADTLMDLVYDELRRLAAFKMSKENPGQTLSPTALVHEAYLRLVDTNPPQTWRHKNHFIAAAAEAMRRILVERARRKKRAKYGGDWQQIPLDSHLVGEEPLGSDLTALDAALDRLEQQDARKAQLVKMRFFAGLTNAESAELLGISVATADRDWAYARVWLLRELKKDDDIAANPASEN